jgi:hypothetical protein
MQKMSGAQYSSRFGEIPTWVVRTAAIAATVALLAMSVPVVWAAVSAGLGLVALTVMAAGGVLLFQSIPWGMQRLENRLLKMRKAEARANPIEQLENDVMRRAARLKSFSGALATVGGQIESIRQMIDERRDKDPGHVLERQQRALQRLTDFYGANLDRLDQAQSTLEQFKSTLAQKKSEWEISIALHDASQMLDPNAADYLIQDLLTDEALRTVQNRFNTVFAELDIQMRREDAPTRTLVSDSGVEFLNPLSLPAASMHGSQS